MQSLENQSLSRTSYEIILVDNGGSTPSVGQYEGQLNTKVLHFKKNTGFAGGNNLALDHSEGELVLLMNQDVVVHFNCLQELILAFVNNPQAGIISANMLMVSQENKVDPYGSLNKTVGQYQLTRLGYASYITRQTNKDLIPVDFVSGNALCFQRNILKDIGNYLFDDRLESYAEDLDLSIRLNRTEWEMYVRPQAVVYHYRDEAFSGSPLYMLQKLFHVSSNRLLVYYHNFPMKVFLQKLPALILGIPAKMTRPDGAQGFNLFNFMVALCCVPLIVAYFGIRVFLISKMDIKKSDPA